MAAAESQLPLLRDAATNQYINGLGRSIARAADPRGIPYTFHIVNSDVTNAFALPGGSVYVTRGLVERCDDVSELAGLLGHQIAHVAERHGDGSAGYSPAAEREADLQAVEYVTRAGVSPQGLVTLFRKLVEMQGRAPSRVEGWLAAHPLSQERIVDVQAAIDATPGGASLRRDTPEFQRFRTRLRELSPQPADRQ